ncbi:MAG: DUF1667 domain-containing protein [Bacilli bacterium]|jgi:CxxC motif-containing protein|nr:DUF1667 domain-containing protein [Bacilli bacterium]
MKQLVCIICPNSCHLTVEKDGDGYKVSGNRCLRGEKFATQEMTNPQRTFSSTVRTVFQKTPLLPVRLNGEIPIDQIFPVMKEINKVLVKTRLKSGDVVIKNVLGLNVDVIATSSLLLKEK